MMKLHVRSIFGVSPFVALASIGFGAMSWGASACSPSSDELAGSADDGDIHISKEQVRDTKADGLDPCISAGLEAGCDLCEAAGWYHDDTCDRWAEDSNLCAHPDPDCFNPMVVGGQAETGYSSVGFLIKDGSPGCGATLIAPKVAVTAAHCLVGASSCGIGFGTVDSGPRYDAIQCISHPDYRSYETAEYGVRHRYDVAVLVFAEPIPDVVPATVVPPQIDPNFDASNPEACAGNTIYIGYGRTTEGNQGENEGYTFERKSAGQCVYFMDDLSVWVRGTDGGLCWGDSGGPLMQVETNNIAGVLSDFADNEFYCKNQNKMIFTSLWAMRSFLEEYTGLGQNPGPSIQPADLLITEIMVDPISGTGDPQNEWFEIFNATDHEINLMSTTLSDNINSFKIAQPVVIASGAYLVFAHSASNDLGFVPDVFYGPANSASGGRGIRLNNDGDQIVITNKDGLEIDRVDYSLAQMPQTKKGTSLAANADRTGWCLSTAEPFNAAGEIGTPKAPFGC